MSWHADAGLLRRYAARELDAATTWSVESHVTGCEICRTRLATSSLVPEQRLAIIRRRVHTRLDAPTPTVVERGLRAIGVPHHQARLLAATPSLTLSWLLAVGFVLATAVAAARWGWRPDAPSNNSLLFFLTLAPLVPLAGVAAAYGPGVDPTYEIGLAAPLRSGKLLLLRAVAVLASSVVVAGVASVFLPTLDWMVAGWIVPALAVTATSLALSTVLSPLVATSTVGASWLLVVVGVEGVADAALAAFGSTGQLTASIVLVASLVVLWSARDRFEHEVGA